MSAPHQRGLFWLALLGVAVLIAGLALLFVWPSISPEDTRFDLGRADAFAIGSVTTVEEGEFHLVRLSEETFIALSWRDPHLGCMVPWRPTFEWNGTRGWFRNGCHGETYDIAGRRAFGPSPRDLDRFVVSVVRGSVVVDTSRYVCGWAPPGAPCTPPPTP